MSRRTARGMVLDGLAKGTVVALILVMASVAGAEVWNTDTTVDSLMGDGTDYLSIASTADTTVTVSGTGGLDYTYLYMGQGNHVGTMVIDGGAVYIGKNVATGVMIGRGGTGILTLNSGTFTNTNRPLYVGISLGTALGHATININGGTFSVGGTTVASNASTGTINQTAGSATFTSLNIGSGTTANGGYSAHYCICGGSMSASSVTVGKVGGLVDALFQVTGSAATVNVSGALTTNTDGVLAFMLDNSANHISRINAGSATFGAGTMIDMGLDGFTPTDGQVFDLLTTTGAMTGFSSDMLKSGDEYIAGVQSGWTLQQSGTTVQAVYNSVVPEPATMGLLGLGLAGLVARRRQRKN